jgi:hypothetical protein
MPPRRFPPPWTVEELDDCFVVKDSTRAVAPKRAIRALPRDFLPDDRETHLTSMNTAKAFLYFTSNRIIVLIGHEA